MEDDVSPDISGNRLAMNGLTLDYAEEGMCLSDEDLQEETLWQHSLVIYVIGADHTIWSNLLPRLGERWLLLFFINMIRAFLLLSLVQLRSAQGC